jgi:cell division protein FtsW
MALVIYLAYSLEKKGQRAAEFSVGFLPHLLVLAMFGALIMMQPDFGSVVLFAVLCWVMMFAGGVRLRHLLSPLLIVLPLGYTVLTQAEYRLRRLASFLDPWEHASDSGYQIVHSLMAFGSGGLWGRGIGQGYQKLFYLPEPHTDFIFSVVGEELGLLGVSVIVLLYGLVIGRGLQIARNARDEFGSLMALGIIAALGMQACVNMGVTLGLLPTKGLTLPFLSYGGTSLLVSMASVGILMNIGASR